MDYEKLSDFEINKRVAESLGYPVRATQNFGDAGLSTVMLEPGFGGHFDPCKNFSDAWPVILKNRIGIIPDAVDGYWKAAHRRVGDDHTPVHMNRSDNALRAAMIVFLSMEDSC